LVPETNMARTRRKMWMSRCMETPKERTSIPKCTLIYIGRNKTARDKRSGMHAEQPLNRNDDIVNTEKGSQERRVVQSLGQIGSIRT
jgi:hypothetical protein